MQRPISIAALLVFIWQSHSSAAEPANLRVAGVDAHAIPKVIVPLDVMRLKDGPPSLRVESFHLLEDGVKTNSADTLLRFRDTGMGLALIVAIDASSSMRGRPMNAIKKGLVQLVDRKRSNDRVAVLTFAEDTRWETNWDSSESATQEAFRTLQTRGSATRLYDALEFTLTEFSRQAEKDDSFPVRRALLVISDGHDEGSRIELPRLLEHLTTSRIRVDTVAVADSSAWFGSLRQLAKSGFGEFQIPAAPEDISDLLARGIDSLLDMSALEFNASQITADGLTHQFGIDYQPTALRDHVSAKVGLPFWQTRRAQAIAAGALAFLLLCGLLIWRTRSPNRASPPAPNLSAAQPTPTPLPPQAPPLARAATAAEPNYGVTRPAQPPPAPAFRYSEPAPSPTPAAAKPQRVPTALASHSRAVGRLRLRATTGPYAGQSFPILEQEFWIGSAANNHLCLGADQSVSGNHVCIRLEQPFHRLYDNGSLNNTWVNGRAVGREVTVIQTGDKVRIGASEFAVEAYGEA